MIKFFVLFVFGISFLFFGLISFQEMSMQKRPPMPPMTTSYGTQQYQSYQGQMPIEPFYDDEPEEPPTYIPCLFVLLLSSIFIFFLFRYLDKNFIAPLVLIEDKLKHISKGNLDVKFETKSENKAVQDTFEILNSMVSGLIEKERLQDEFIQNLAHDLRSPVIAQERAIAILKDEFKDHELLEGLMENSETYLKMINLVIEAHNKRDYVINKTQINYHSLVEAIFNGLKSLAVSKNIELINNVELNTVVFADYISLNRITMNLVSNAIENIGYNKHIKVSAKSNSDKTLITIEDDGQGIPKDKLDKLFEKHVSINKTGKKAISGLGLTITRELVEKNQGTIKAESEENQYTRFIIELPQKDK